MCACVQLREVPGENFEDFISVFWEVWKMKKISSPRAEACARTLERETHNSLLLMSHAQGRERRRASVASREAPSPRNINGAPRG